MYNFYYGDRSKIEEDEFGYLLNIKRMLPRYLNSLPDKSFLFMDEIIRKYVDVKKPVFVETGIGASTILLLHHAMKTNGKLLSWDMNSSKASAIHQVCSETIGAYHGKSVTEHWTFISSDTTSEYTGIAIADELTNSVDFSVHDSNHTWDVINHEVSAMLAMMKEGSVICVDDANQTAVHTYDPIINITRKKLGLAVIPPIENNEGPAHFKKLPDVYKEYFEVEELESDSVASFKDDLYYHWYSNDREQMNGVGMERFDEHEKRFVAHKMIKKISC